MPKTPRGQQTTNTTELAKHLGISRWTVSRVLNGHDDVSEKTRKRVMDAIEKLGFRPSVLARGLRGGRTGVIGISFQEIESPILAKKVGQLQRRLRAAGQRGILELNSGDRAAEVTTLQHFIDFRVDAIVLFGSRLSAQDTIIREILSRKLPVLAVDPEFALPVPTIRLDRAEAMSQIVRHLLALKHRRFALLGFESDPIYGPMRVDGLRHALLEASIDPNRALVHVGDFNADLWSYAYGRSLGMQWMQLRYPPKVAIALNDRIAIGAMHALAEKGLSIPQDFSIVGFDDLDIAQWTTPPLTTVSQETTQSTEAIVETLQQLLEEGTSVSPMRTIVPQLICRESTAKAR